MYTFTAHANIVVCSRLWTLCVGVEKHKRLMDDGLTLNMAESIHDGMHPATSCMYETNIKILAQDVEVEGLVVPRDF